MRKDSHAAAFDSGGMILRDIMDTSNACALAINREHSGDPNINFLSHMIKQSTSPGRSVGSGGGRRVKTANKTTRSMVNKSSVGANNSI